MIHTEGLSKVFGRPPGAVTAVADLSLDVAEGEVFGFLGPNGAGKTTTVRMLTCLIAPTGGRATVNGHAVADEAGRDAIRASIGLLTETPGMYERLSAEKNLLIYARLYGVAGDRGQVEKYLRLLGLWERRHDEVGSFSKGMRQKLAIARALLHEPRVLFLDEPTSGLDPEAARLVRDFIAELRAAGRTIVLCTHNLDEADRLCDRIGIFKTRLITVDTPANLRRQLYGRRVVFHLRRAGEDLAAAARAAPFVRAVQRVEDKLVVTLDDPETGNPELVRRLVAAGADVQFVGELRHSLEDVYLRLIGDGGAPASP
jgi:ABC-2 type transport system ATP-binding protein